MLFEEAARAVAARYESRPAHYYVRSKLALDPVARKLTELAASEPFGDVLDVACGRGQVGLLLLAMGLAETVTGLDWDAPKVAIAEKAAAGTATFARGDVRTAHLPRADTVLLIDILHYLSREEQDALVARAARAARRQVIVRDVDPDQGATSALTRGWEWVTTSLGYNRGARVLPRSFDELTALFEAEGLTVTREPCSAKGMSNVLLIARAEQNAALA